MASPVSTIAASTRAGCAKAFPAISQSFDNRQVDAFARPLRHGRINPYQFQTPVFSSPVIGNLGVERFGALPHFHSRAVNGCNRPSHKSRPNKPHLQTACRVIAHLNRLSSAVSVGIDPNENGLTYGEQALSPRGKTYD